MSSTMQVIEAVSLLMTHMQADRRQGVLRGVLSLITQPLQEALQHNSEEGVVMMADRLTVVFRWVCAYVLLVCECGEGVLEGRRV